MPKEKKLFLWGRGLMPLKDKNHYSNNLIVNEH